MSADDPRGEPTTTADDAISTAVAAVRRRLRLRLAARGATIGAWVGCGLAAVWVGAWVLRWVELPHVAWLLAPFLATLISSSKAPGGAWPGVMVPLESTAANVSSGKSRRSPRFMRRISV